MRGGGGSAARLVVQVRLPRFLYYVSSHHAMTEGDLTFALWTLIDARQEAARQSQSFL